MNLDLTHDQIELVRDLVTEELKSTKSGSTVYGDAEYQAEVVEDLKEILDEIRKTVG